MPDGEPVNLVVAIVFAVVGCCLAVFLVVRFVLEVRTRRALRADGPDVTAFDADIRRYIDRVYLMVAAWTPRLEAEAAAQVQELWEDAYDRARALQDARSADAEVAADVAGLVALEKEIDERIGRSISS